MAHLADDLRARIEILVDAVAEAHEPEVARLVLGQVEILRDVVGGPDLLEHREHGLVGAAMGRAPERRHAGRDRCVRIRAGASREADGGGARVLLMVGVQNKQQIERLRGDRVHLVGLAGYREQHVQQVAAVIEIVARINERLADRVFVRGCRDRRNLRDHAVREDLAMPRVIDVHRVVIERGHRGHHRRHHRHRMGVVVEAVEETQQRLIQHRVVADVVGELIELLATGQLAGQQQVRALHEGALFRELLDREAAI